MSARVAFGVKKEPLTSGERTKRRCKPLCPRINAANLINPANLNTNLITKMDLSGVESVEKTEDKYVIDPNGTLFGTNVCGLNNYLKYRQDNQ
jgi:hypothetical protein